jgi:Bifunctional DNA primase/polymerase, N-terminal/Primase C terminal 2 (PriCT-2)
LEKAGHVPVPLYPGTKRPAVAGWPDYVFNPADEFSRPFRFGGLRYPNYETGIICGETVGLDIDVRDARMVRKLLALASRLLGSGPDRTGQPPKVLRVYRATQPFSKLRSRLFSLPGDDVEDADYRPHMIEILGRGAQFVCEAMHNKTGKPYTWSASQGLANIPASSLTMRSEEQFREYIAAAEALLLARGAKVFGKTITTDTKARSPQITLPNLPRGRRRQLAQDAGEQYASAAGTVKHDAAACRAALSALPNRDVDYDTWWKIGTACASALGESGRKDFLAWSARSKKHDSKSKDFSNRSYNYFLKYAASGKSQISGGTLIFLAKQAGWAAKPRRPPYWQRPTVGTKVPA